MDLRKIDALVAEHVMGWTMNARDVWLDASGKDVGYSENVYDTDPGWRPSSDIAAAWEVVEKLHGRLGKWQIGWEDGRVVEDIYEAMLTHPSSTADEPRHVEAHGSTWEQAWQRCLVAWLEAKGIEP